MTRIITSDRDKVLAFNEITDLPEDGSYEVIIQKIVKHRTGAQNRSLHQYLRLMAIAMQEAGITQRALFSSLKEGFDVDPTMESLKTIVNKVSDNMFGRSTSKLSTVEIQKLYEAVNAGFGQTVGVSLPWPSNEPPPFEGE